MLTAAAVVVVVDSTVVVVVIAVAAAIVVVVLETTGLNVVAAVAGRPAAVDVVVVPVHAVFCVDSHDIAWRKSFQRFHI